MKNSMLLWLRKIEWVNFLFITLTPVAAIWGSVWTWRHGGLLWPTWILTVVMMILTGLGITGGYHRLFTHRSFQATWIVRLVFLLLGGAAFEGSAREWCCAHRKHHRFVDAEGDPYNIRKGFWHAHVGWVILKADQSDESNIPDLKQDPLVLFQDRFYILLAVLVGFALPTVLAATWGDPWGGLFLAGFARIVINLHLTFLINSYCHFFGKQTYSNNDTARDSGLISFFTYGEGYHNFHHAFQADYRNGVRAYHWDPAKWLIRVLSWTRLASGLKRVAPQRILAAKLRMDELRLRERLAYRKMLSGEWDHLVAQARENVEKMYQRLMELKMEYRRLKKEKTDSMDENLRRLRQEMRQIRREFKFAMAYWRWLIRGLNFGV